MASGLEILRVFIIEGEDVVLPWSRYYEGVIKTRHCQKGAITTITLGPMNSGPNGHMVRIF